MSDTSLAWSSGLRRDLSVDGIELGDVSSPGLRRGASGSPEGDRREWFPEEVRKDLLAAWQLALETLT